VIHPETSELVMTPDTSLQIPRHVAVIMDGNNRWARARGLPTKSGHRHGAEAARDLVNSCVRREIPYLTLFAFSSENWIRPSTEVRGLMALFLSVLRRHEIRHFHRKNVRFRFVGRRSDFSSKLQKNMTDVEELTRNNTGTTVIVAADYGGRWDITQAAQALVKQVEQGELSRDEITIERLHAHTALGAYPDPDFCIRTGVEKRISNFLLWQFAYTEFYFTNSYWPDFNDEEFQLALDDYARRQRRFGGHEDQCDAHG